MTNYKCSKKSCTADTVILALMLINFFFGFGFAIKSIVDVNNNKCTIWIVKGTGWLALIMAFLVLCELVKSAFQNRPSWIYLVGFILILVISVLNVVVLLKIQSEIECNQNNTLVTATTVVDLIFFIVILFYIAGYDF